MTTKFAVSTRGPSRATRPRHLIAATSLVGLLLSPTPSTSEINRDAASVSALELPWAFASRCNGVSIAPPAAAASCPVTEDEPIRLAQYMSNICYTPIGWCYLPAFAPIGSPCWCPSPYGPVSGYVR